jgi:glycosyltransferase involved in cell wall biosynthesis
LFVGTLEPRKNLKRLLQAYEILKSRKTDLQLVIAGSDGWEQISPKTDIIRAEKPSSHDLAALFSGAEVLAYPSLYEGFGLPILEAFWYGVPVVTSDVSSLPEVGGAAAVYVDPHEADAIADGIQTAVKKKKELIQKGKKQLKKFSWKTAAQQTLDVYRKAYFMESGKREKQNK